MRGFLIVTFIVFITSVFGQTINGKIIDGLREVTILQAVVQLLDSNGAELIKKTETNEDGVFKFTNVTPGIYAIRIQSFYVMFPRDSIFYGIDIKGDTNITLDMHEFCQYDVTLKSKICPICHKKDKAIRIIYGLLVSSKGRPMKNEGKKFISGGCKVSRCDPYMYCKRDKKEF